ncbi:exported hypothetical protein [metagenome]|uniref:Integral membrane protein n=1 Tax=metagenome TaxID=256318 RepID=A0A2P2BYU0_9ZZZZ
MRPTHACLLHGTEEPMLKLLAVAFVVVVVAVIAALLVVALNGSHGTSAWVVLGIWVFFSGLIALAVLRSVVR